MSTREKIIEWMEKIVKEKGNFTAKEYYEYVCQQLGKSFWSARDLLRALRIEGIVVNVERGVYTLANTRKKRK